MFRRWLKYWSENIGGCASSSTVKKRVDMVQAWLVDLRVHGVIIWWCNGKNSTWVSDKKIDGGMVLPLWWNLFFKMFTGFRSCLWRLMNNDPNKIGFERAERWGIRLLWVQNSYKHQIICASIRRKWLVPLLHHSCTFFKWPYPRPSGNGCQNFSKNYRVVQGGGSKGRGFPNLP